MKFGTKAIHAGVSPDPSTGAIMTPIFQTSTYVQDEPGVHKGHEYSRTSNPTRSALQNSLAALENGKHGLCFSSGLAAIDCLMKTMSPGDHVLSTSDLYGGTYRIYTKIFEKFGVEFDFIGMEDAGAVEAHVKPNTKLIWVETPTNPMMNIIDIKAMADIAKRKGCLLAVDNTFASPYLQNPLDLGADIVMHSITKYLAGHSDVVMGCLVTNDDDLAEQFAFIQNSSGATPGPQDCFLVLRGIKTLHLRMQRHCENGAKIAHFLKAHPRISKVYWPGFEGHVNHTIAKAQMRDFGGMISFVVDGASMEETCKIISKFKVFALAESLGGVESLVGHPASMTHAAIPREERLKTGLEDSLIRLSVGVEDVEDLIADLERVLG